MMFSLNELITNTKSFFLIAGPCAIESEEMAFKYAKRSMILLKSLK